MTDYSERVRGAGHKAGIASGATLAIFLVGFVLSLIAIFGIVNSRKGKEVLTAKWDGVSSFVFVIDGTTDFLAVMQKNPKRVALISLGDTIPSADSPEELVKYASARSGVVVKNYLKNNNEDVVENFEKFTSYFTPLKIVLGGWDQKSSNITRYDAIRLWWQTKSIGVKEVSQIEINNNLGKENVEMVLGARTADVNRILTPYVENLVILEEGMEINIVNASGNLNSGMLADMFISSVGGRVTSVAGSGSLVEKCLIEGAESYTKEYLAKTFDCDITDQVLGEPVDVLTFTVGQDFAQTYF